MADDERKKWRGRLLQSGEGTFRPVDQDERPHPQVSQGLAALRRAQRPTLRSRDGQRFGQPATAGAPAEVHTLPQRRGEPDTAPGRPPGDAPGPTGGPDPAVPPANLGWGTRPAVEPEPDWAENPANPVGTPPSDTLTVSRAELQVMVSDAVRAQLGPIAEAISEMRSHMTGAPVVVEEALPPEPVALLPLMDDAPPSEPVVALSIPDEHDWTQGKAQEFAHPPAQAQG